MSKKRKVVYSITAGISAALVIGAVQAHQAGRDFPEAPALSDGVWVNGKPTTLAAHRGKVVVLAFWTHQCINCKRTLPFWNRWAEKYAGKDVVVLSVHTPEFDSEKVPENVRRFSHEAGLRFPVVTDNDSKTWNAYRVRYWPTTFLIDRQGRIRYNWEGELDYRGSDEFRRVEQTIEALRKEKQP